jgi:hypothetical protein
VELDELRAARVDLSLSDEPSSASEPPQNLELPLGLDIADLRAAAPDQALQQIAIALQGYGDEQRKAQIVAALFGKSIREVAPLLKDLADAGQLNATVTKDQAEQVERFNKELFKLSAYSAEAGRSMTIWILSHSDTAPFLLWRGKAPRRVLAGDVGGQTNRQGKHHGKTERRISRRNRRARGRRPAIRRNRRRGATRAARRSSLILTPRTSSP